MRVTVFLIIINFVIFILQFILQGFTNSFALIPVNALGGSYWQFLTYMFLHDNPMHIGLNMFVLLIFGISVERALGMRRYLFLYFVSGIGSAILHILLTGISDILLLGASGAVFGVLTAFAFLYPDAKLIIIPIPYPISAKYIVLGFVALSLFLGFTNILGDNIAYFGHLGGIMTGVILMSYWKYVKKQRAEVEDFEFLWE